MAVKVMEGMRWGEEFLQEKGVENARYDADLLLAEALGWPRNQLYLDREYDLSEYQESIFRKGILRRSEHEPLQYILQHQDFMGLPFYIDERVLIPRADSEVLVEKWLELVTAESSQEKRKIKVADLCTGSGILAVSMKYYFPLAEVVGTDISFDALKVAGLNAERMGVQVEWRQGDFVTPIRGELWDWIVMNPPYVSEEEYHQCAPEIFFEPSIAFLGGQDGLDFYRRLANEIQSLLTPRGKLLMEIGWQQAEPICGIFKKSGFETDVFLDLAGRNRVILAR
jgi:release factor glutamine methyltransferase